MVLGGFSRRSHVLRGLVPTLGLILVLFIQGASRAASMDPGLKWKTVSTEHFIVHYYEGEELAVIGGPG